MRFRSQLQSRPLIVLIVLLLAVPLATHLAAAQSSPPSQKAPPPAPLDAEDQEQFISYWTTETGWRTELDLRNNQVDQPLTVTPVLRATDGAEISLSAVVVLPQEVRTLDVATAIGNSAPQLIGAYGSLVLRYRAPSGVNLYAVAMIMGVGHSIAFHIDGAGEDQTQDLGSREGIWWLPNTSASDYLILANRGQNPLKTDLSVSDASGKSSAQTITLAPRGVARYSIRQIVAAAKLGGSYGGIKISAANHAGSLDTLHVLFNETGSFSAVMKMFDYDPRAQLKERDYARTGKWTLRAPMLALANPDPSLAFPEGTVLLPQLFIRNVTSKPVEAVLAFNWRMDTSTGKAFGPALHLNPLETRRIDVAALQDGKTLPQNAQWSSVMLTTNALPGEVVAVAASYDKSLRYGAQTPFSDQLASHWAASQWQYDPQHDSVITVGNGGTKPTRAAFTIFYNQGTQKYQLEQTLQPDEQMWIDVGKLIRESIHDKNGKPLPADLTSGSYEIWDLTHRGIGTLFEGKVIYDKTYGHVTYGCTLCCGFQRLARFSSPLYIPINGTSSDGVKGLDSCSQLYSDISSDFDGNWTTVNPSVTTVDCCGTFTGQGAGSTTSSTFADEPWHVSNYSCPIMNRNSQGNDNVTPAISGPNTVWYFSNLTVSGYATSIQLTSSGGSSTTWNITAGTGEITVSSFTGASINVLSSGTAFSSSVGDVKLTATTNGQTSAPYSLTTRTPNRLVPGAINNICDGHGGYLTTLGYTIQDQLMTPLPSAVPLNENWTTGVFKDYTGTNWTFPVPGFGTTQAPNFAFFADAISADENQNPPIPAYTCDGDSTPVEHIGQEWRIGSLATGTGRRVQTDTLQRYKGRAVHLSIVSPAP